MRKFYTLLKPYLQDVLNLARHENCITQEDMADFFYMSARLSSQRSNGAGGPGVL